MVIVLKLSMQIRRWPANLSLNFRNRDKVTIYFSPPSGEEDEEPFGGGDHKTIITRVTSSVAN